MCAIVEPNQNLQKSRVPGPTLSTSSQNCWTSFSRHNLAVNSDSLCRLIETCLSFLPSGRAYYQHGNGRPFKCSFLGPSAWVMDQTSLSINARPSCVVHRSTAANQGAGAMDFRFQPTECRVVGWTFQSSVLLNSHWAIDGQKERVAVGSNDSTSWRDQEAERRLQRPASRRSLHPWPLYGRCKVGHADWNDSWVSFEGVDACNACDGNKSHPCGQARC